MPCHYAIKKLPGTMEEKILFQRRMAKLGICVIWIESHDQIEEILAYLVEKPPVPDVSWAKMGAFVGREEQLAEIAANLETAAGATGAVGGVQAITGRLYSIDGIGGVGKTALALEAARRFGDKFKDGVLPLFRADELTPVSFAMALAAGLGIQLPEPKDAEAARQAVASLLKNRRCMVLLDNVEKWEDLRYMIPPQMSASVLVTTRNRDICRKIQNHCPGLWVKEIALDKFTPEETLALFRKMLGNAYREEEEEVYLEIGRALGFLPIALRQAIALMAYTPHYRAMELRDRLKSDSRLELLRKGCAEVESDTRVIETVFDLSAPVLTGELKDVLGMVAVCSPGPVPLDFLEKLAGAKVPELVEIIERLYTYSWCERREVEGQRYYELHQLVREVVRAQAQEPGGQLPYLEEFIDVVHGIFTDKDVHFRVKERYIFQLEEAFAAAVQLQDPRLKDWLYNLYYFCTYRGYAHFYLRLTEAVERLFPGDKWALRAVYGNQALILRRWGKLEEAMAMLKKQEAICEELGDRAGLSACYGNQALILSDWGKLEEAMAMLKKQEAICEELGDRAGLSKSYCGQALILKAWGKLDEAMAMHQKQEAICEELGDRAGLSRSYGNQALILSDWGKLEEAMAMHKKEEAICEELGDRAGLARTWWNQGLIFAKQNDPDTQAQLWRKSIDTNKTMGIPTDDDEKELKELLEKEKKK
jgi:tetratricopeptide (TPR) repeat protein